MFTHLYFSDDIVDLLSLESNKPRDEVVKNVCAFLSTMIPAKLGFTDPVRLHTTVTYDVTNEDRPASIHEYYVSDGLPEGGSFIVVATIEPFEVSRVKSIRDKTLEVLNSPDLLEAEYYDLMMRVVPEEWTQQDFAFAMGSYLSLADRVKRNLIALTLNVGEANTTINTVVYHEKGNSHA